MSATTRAQITLSPGLCVHSSDEVERVLSALMARREPLAALSQAAPTRVEAALGRPDEAVHRRRAALGGVRSRRCSSASSTFIAEFGGMHIGFPASDPVLSPRRDARDPHGLPQKSP